MNPSAIYIISGGVGASGEQLVHTVLAQFPGQQIRVVTIGNVRLWEQIAHIVHQAVETRGLIVHTLVDSNLREKLVETARELDVPAIDLMGELIARLAEMLGQKPAEQPGLYRILRQDYFDRIGAIEYSMAHDDGKNTEGLPQAEMIIAGVSRVGKTPLSLYLSVQGWRVANVPIIMGVEAPADLFRVDPARVIGLTIEPGQLILHRQQRQSRIGAPGPSAYTDPQAVYEEIEYARSFFKRHGFATVDVTDKPIETSADELIRLIARRTHTATTRDDRG